MKKLSILFLILLSGCTTTDHTEYVYDVPDEFNDSQLEQSEAPYCILSYSTSTDGTTKNVIAHFCSSEEFKVPSIESVKKYVFKPATPNAKPTKTECIFIKLSFRLDKKTDKEQIENARERGWPIPVHIAQPIYPVRMELLSTEGYVIVNYDVNRSGNPINISVVESSPEGFFEQSAVQSVKHYKYENSTKEYKDMEIKISFKMEGPSPESIGDCIKTPSYHLGFRE